MDDTENLYEEIAESIALIEYYYKVHIKGDYPVMKRFNQMEHLNKAFEIDVKRYGLSGD